LILLTRGTPVRGSAGPSRWKKAHPGPFAFISPANKIHEIMQVQIGLGSVAEVDHEVLRWLKQAYVEHC
jgi:hypothetical protein